MTSPTTENHRALHVEISNGCAAACKPKKERYTFAEASIVLAPGDVLAAFSDGVTDAGPSRKHLPDVDGVTDPIALLVSVGVNAGAAGILPAVLKQ